MFFIKFLVCVWYSVCISLILGDMGETSDLRWIPLHNLYMLCKQLFGADYGFICIAALIPYVWIAFMIVSSFFLMRKYELPEQYLAGLIFLNPLYVGRLALYKPIYAKEFGKRVERKDAGQSPTTSER